MGVSNILYKTLDVMMGALLYTFACSRSGFMASRLLRLEDKLQGHKFFRRAAHSAMDCYLAMHDSPHKTGANGTSDASGENTGMLHVRFLLMTFCYARDFFFCFPEEEGTALP